MPPEILSLYLYERTCPPRPELSPEQTDATDLKDLVVETEEENIILEAWRNATKHPDDAKIAIKAIAQVVEISTKASLSTVLGRKAVFGGEVPKGK